MIFRTLKRGPDNVYDFVLVRIPRVDHCSFCVQPHFYRVQYVVPYHHSVEVSRFSSQAVELSPNWVFYLNSNKITDKGSSSRGLWNV